MERLTNAHISELTSLCPDGVRRDVDLSAISNWRIGGTADLILLPANRDQLSSLLFWLSEREISTVVIGLTSNLLFDDAGLRVPCIQIGSRMAGLSINGARVMAEAGIWVPRLARNLMQAGLGGAEHICGIPGTLGGLVCMNGGSQRKGIGSIVESVESVDFRGVVRLRTAAECKFGYRQSIFQVNGEIITKVNLLLTQRSMQEIKTEMLTILAERRKKFPRKEPNCGSVFKSNPAMYEKVGAPGSVIERFGFKGKRVGGAVISTHHANFIINNGGASACDVLSLISEVRRKVLDETGYEMDVEVKFVHSSGKMEPAFDVNVCNANI